MAPPSLPKPPGPLPADGPAHRTGSFGLPPTPASAGLARRNVRELLGAWGADPEACDNAVLVTSELVTNALTHTVSERVVCRLRTDGHRLHLEVEDQNLGPAVPAQRTAGPDDQGGRGLLLVGVVSSDWGVRDSAHGSGRVVWAVLPMRPAVTPAVPVPAQTPVPARIPAPRPPSEPAPRPASRSTSPSPSPSSSASGPRPSASSEPWETASSGLAVSLPHPTRPAPHSAEGSLPHGTAVRP
ncbi:ATP-binding protein [Streptomyces beigongshangae]|uniref:ATP-binding protein n=1 Tax=Streptomyces beigongshangae TaxID=2841597 RepID=UPI0021A50A3A|nr:ATP-binding protein [Streptomyces sp. REN17]